jgi:hypothetical protein
LCKDGHLIEKAIQETWLQVRADILDETTATDEKEIRYPKWIF